MDVLDLLANDNYIIYNKTLAKHIGLENAILFGLFCSYQRLYRNQEFYKEQSTLINETCLTEYAVRKSIKDLQELKLLNVERKGCPAKFYYCVNEEQVLRILQTRPCEIATSSGVEIAKSSGDEIKGINKNTNNNIEYKNTNINNNIIIALPLNNGTSYNVSPEEFELYQQLYPAVDVKKELNKMLGWLYSNPKNRKTKQGIKRFINTWLSKAQDYAPILNNVKQPEGFKKVSSIISEDVKPEKMEKSNTEIIDDAAEKALEEWHKLYG